VGIKLATIAALCALAAAPAMAQKSTEDGLRDCEKLAAVKFKQENPSFKKFAIERGDSLEEDQYTGKVGTQPVTTIYHGRAVYQSSGEPDSVRFICLHAGLGKGAVFVYIMPK
jgi:hypothetical protein